MLMTENSEILSLINELKALILKQNKLLTDRFSSDKLSVVLKMLEESPEKKITVDDVINRLGVSRNYALELMNQAASSNEDILKISGHSRCPTCLYLIDSNNKDNFLVFHTLKSLKKQGKGSTKRISAIMTETGLDIEGVKVLVPQIIKLSNHKVRFDQEHNPLDYKERRLKNYGL